MHSLNDMNGGLNRLFGGVLEKASGNLGPNDLIRLCIQSKSLEKPISTPLLPKSEMTPEKILTEVEKVAQSGKEIPLDEALKVNVITVKQPVGRGRPRTRVINIAMSSLKKTSIITIKNDDSLCCPRAIVVGEAYLRNASNKRYVSDARKPLQLKLAKELCLKAGVREGPCGFPEIESFSNYLNIQILVVDAASFNKVRILCYFDY